MDKAEAIIAISKQLFAIKGIRSVTMNEIAQNCGISKKTLYQFFDDKEKLIHTIVKQSLYQFSEELRRLSEDSISAVDEMKSSFKYFLTLVDVFTPLFMNDICKSYSLLYQQILAELDTILLNFIKCNVLRGIHENSYRNSIDVTALSNWAIWHLHGVVKDISLQDKNVRHNVINFENTIFHRYLSKER